MMLLCGMLVAMVPLGMATDERSLAIDTALSTPESSTIFVDGSQGISQKPQHYAVIVGISDYKAIGDLNFCDEDANDWYTYLSQMGYDEIVVLGDHTSPYLQYDGLATEHNAKLALIDLVSKAGPKDTIAFISSGHGSGDSRGSSLLCMWDITDGEDGEDGYFWDTEVADILEHSVADQIFVFLDHCFAGGFGEELMNMPNSENVYFASTCDIMGMGWDAGACRPVQNQDFGKLGVLILSCSPHRFLIEHGLYQILQNL